MCYRHDKRLRIFSSLIRLFFTISVVVLFSSFLFKMAVFFLFLRNVHSSIEILKLKIPEHSDPPSQHFFVHKAFSRPLLRRRKVVLCHLAEWHTLALLCQTSTCTGPTGDKETALELWGDTAQALPPTNRSTQKNWTWPVFENLKTSMLENCSLTDHNRIEAYPGKMAGSWLQDLPSSN